MGLQRALLSVADKSGVTDFARFLHEHGIEIVSTGGTARHLEEHGLPVTNVESLVGFPHLLGGRVKTLAPQVHGGILADRDVPDQVAELAAHDIGTIDLVAIDLYPFEAAMASGAGLARLVEEIDIGGVTLLRAAAKNHAHVTVLSGPEDYATVREAIERAVAEAGAPSTDAALRRRLAHKAFLRTAAYDATIAQGIGAAFADPDLPRFPDHLALPLHKVQDLRYGENHHQEAALYRDLSPSAASTVNLIDARQLQGKRLSYNNLLDGDIVLSTVREFEDPVVVIVKHATPSGVATAVDLKTAWHDAFATDTYSPFGGIIGVNRPLDGETAGEMSDLFLELILAPRFSAEAREVLGRKKNLRLLEVPGLDRPYHEDPSEPAGAPRLVHRAIHGGAIVQDRDLRPFDPASWKTVTKKAPTKEQLATMRFAARVVKHVKSNAVVFAKDTRTVGIGGGQTARVDSSWIACHKGGDNIRGSVMASDAFFPFRDAVDVAAEHGVEAIVQPGGSIRDDEVFAAADEHGIAMVTTGHRLFAH